MTRDEHLEWTKKRALEYLDAGDPAQGFTSMLSDLRKHPDTENHVGVRIGIGTACTIRNVIGDKPYEGVRFGRPEPPAPEPFTDKFKAEGRKRIDSMLTHMQLAKKMADGLLDGTDKPTKSNIKAMVQGLSMAIQELHSNVPYVLTTLDEQTEIRMQKAVTEFESYVSTRLTHMGLEALKGQAPRLTAGEEDIKALPEATGD